MALEKGQDLMENINIKLNKKGFQLRFWDLKDAESLANYGNNKKIWLNMRDEYPFPYSIDDAKKAINKSKAKDQIQLAISNDHEAIGSISVTFNDDIRRKSGVLSYWIGQPFWGKGITSLSVDALSEWVFHNKDIIRLYAKVFANNPSSQKVLEKAGYNLEGHFKKAIIKDGEIIDQLLFAKVL